MEISTKAKLISTALVAAALAAPFERIAEALAGRTGAAECL
jgi:hypothetical protein